MIKSAYRDARNAAIAEFERTWLLEQLELHRHNISTIARENGVDRVYVHRLMRRHNIKRVSVAVPVVCV